MKHIQLINLLADGRFYSGEQLGQALGVSRSAVWKHVKQLERRGISIFGVRGKGYRLADPLELLSEELIAPYLNEQSRSYLEKIEIFSEIDSTNRHLLRNVYVKRNGARVCLAEFQTEGKGRRGRDWFSPFGQGICMSILWTFNKGINALEGLSLVTSIAVVRTLRRFAILGVGIKWPNDIYWNGRKLAGILLELSGENSGPCQVVIGIGMNLRMSAETAANIENPWTDLYTISGGINIARNRLAGELINQLVDVLVEFEKRGWSAFVDEWSAHDILAGKPIVAMTPQREFEGEAVGVDTTGALMVKTSDGLQRLVSADVSVRRLTS